MVSGTFVKIPSKHSKEFPQDDKVLHKDSQKASSFFMMGLKTCNNILKYNS